MLLLLFTLSKTSLPKKFQMRWMKYTPKFQMRLKTMHRRIMFGQRPKSAFQTGWIVLQFQPIPNMESQPKFLPLFLQPFNIIYINFSSVYIYDSGKDINNKNIITNLLFTWNLWCATHKYWCHRKNWELVFHQPNYTILRALMYQNQDQQTMSSFHQMKA